MEKERQRSEPHPLVRLRALQLPITFTLRLLAWDGLSEELPPSSQQLSYLPKWNRPRRQVD